MPGALLDRPIPGSSICVYFRASGLYISRNGTVDICLAWATAQSVLRMVNVHVEGFSSRGSKHCPQAHISGAWQNRSCRWNQGAGELTPQARTGADTVCGRCRHIPMWRYRCTSSISPTSAHCFLGTGNHGSTGARGCWLAACHTGLLGEP